MQLEHSRPDAIARFDHRGYSEYGSPKSRYGEIPQETRRQHAAKILQSFDRSRLFMGCHRVVDGDRFHHCIDLAAGFDVQLESDLWVICDQIIVPPTSTDTPFAVGRPILRSPSPENIHHADVRGRVRPAHIAGADAKPQAFASLQPRCRDPELPA